jgi:hypothetical protein
MGRTIPSFRMALDEEVRAWKSFRDALRIDEREIFDDLMDQCRIRASAASAATRSTITEAMFMTLLFLHHKKIKRLQKLLEEIEKIDEVKV